MMSVVGGLPEMLAQALRRLRIEWRFTLTFVITLALGIAANAAVFSALDAYALRPLPYPHSSRLVNIYFNLRKGGVPDGLISVPAYERFRQLPAITNAGLVGGGTFATVKVGNEPVETLDAAHVTASAFATVGVRPLLGRWFSDSADHPQGPREAVLSYGLWQSAFRGRHQALGQSLRVNGDLYTVVGVMPRDFAFPIRDTALWLPDVIPPAQFKSSSLTNWNGAMIARLKPEISRAALQAQLNLAAGRIEQGVSPHERAQLKAGGLFAAATSLQHFVARGTTRRLVIMQFGAGILLLLAVASLVNLAIVRALQRRHTLAIHVALGAESMQLLLMALCEALPLSAIAMILAWPLGHLGARAFTWFGVASESTPFRLAQGPSLWLIAFALALLLSSFVLAIPQALMPFRQPGQLLHGSTRETRGARATRHLRQGLSITQIALAVLLLVVAALLGLSVRQMLRPHRGLRSDGLFVASLILQGTANATRHPDAYYAAVSDLANAASRISGVMAVGFGEGAPFTSSSGSDFRRQSRQQGLMASITLVGPGFLRALGVRLLQGRLITRESISSDSQIIVVDRRFARALFGTADVVGRYIVSNSVRWRIIGVVETIPDQFAAHYAWTQGTVFLPEAGKALDIWGGGGDTTILIDSNRPVRQLKQEFLVAMHRLLPEQSLVGIYSMNRLIAASAKGTSAVASLVIASALLAFVLAIVGTYGVIAYAAGLRRQEFAIRQALGATASKIQWIIMNQGLFLWGIGAVLGVCLAAVLAKLLQGQFYHVNYLTVRAYLVPVAALGCVVALASWLAVRRQWKVTPQELLQFD